MITVNGTFNQRVKAVREVGGYNTIFEGQHSLYVGGFNYNLDDLPEPGSVLPSGTPVQVDEEARTIVPLITLLVTTGTDTNTDTGTDTNTVTVSKIVGGRNVGTRVKVGQKLINISTDSTITNIDSTDSTDSTITNIDSSAADVDVITLDSKLSATAGDVLAVACDDGSGMKCTPNGLAPYDVALDADAVAADGDASYHNTRPVLVNRMPPITDSIKEALKNAGCTFVWSERK